MIYKFCCFKIEDYNINNIKQFFLQWSYQVKPQNFTKKTSNPQKIPDKLKDTYLCWTTIGDTDGLTGQ